MNARYEPGERVRLTVDARVTSSDKRDIFVAYDTELGPHEMGVALDSAAVKVERIAPPEWPPQAGDLWDDAAGVRWVYVVSANRDQKESAAFFAVDSVTDRFKRFPRGADDMLAKHGPLTLVYREGWSPRPAAQVDDQADDQADEPVDERAAMVAGIRQLADLIEAHPDLPATAHHLGVSVYVNNMPHIRNDDALGFAELRRLAAILGVQPDLRDEPGSMHPTARLRLAGGVAYEATYITEAYKRGYKPVDAEPVPPAAVAALTPDDPSLPDGSPSDLDGPPDPPFGCVHAALGGAR